MTTTRCECGTWSGEYCEGQDPTVEVEFMPRDVRAAHENARNRGRYPHNGAVRIWVTASCADDMMLADGEWCEIVREVAR